MRSEEKRPFSRTKKALIGVTLLSGLALASNVWADYLNPYPYFAGVMFWDKVTSSATETDDSAILMEWGNVGYCPDGWTKQSGGCKNTALNEFITGWMRFDIYSRYVIVEIANYGTHCDCDATDECYAEDCADFQQTGDAAVRIYSKNASCSSSSGTWTRRSQFWLHYFWREPAFVDAANDSCLLVARGDNGNLNPSPRLYAVDAVDL